MTTQEVSGQQQGGWFGGDSKDWESQVMYKGISDSFFQQVRDEVRSIQGLQGLTYHEGTGGVTLTLRGTTQAISQIASLVARYKSVTQREPVMAGGQSLAGGTRQ